MAGELRWQLDDITDLPAGAPVDVIRSNAATQLRAGITTGVWSAEPPASTRPT